jgi:hypothetical protein
MCQHLVTSLFSLGSACFYMTLEWLYIKHCFCIVLACLSFQYVKLACSYFPHKLQHWETLRGFYWGKSQCPKKIWTRERTDDISHAPWPNKSSLHTSCESAAMIKNTVKSVSLFSTVIRADNDGPNMEHSSNVLNVQAAITWYTRMCKDMKWKVNLATVFQKRNLTCILEYRTILHSW